MGDIKWYKRDPDAALAGMMQLTLEERGAYNTVLDLIYSKADKLPDDDHFIAGFLASDVRVWKRIKAKLISLGKIRVEEGLLRNFRATSEVDAALLRVASASDAGKQSAAAKAAKKKAQESQNNGLVSTPVSTEVQRPFQQSTATATTTSTNHHHPKNGTGNGHAKAADDKTVFAECDSALRNIEGIGAHPVAVAPVIAPIWQLVQAGYSLHATVIPSVRRQVAAAGKPISRWSYFVKGILDDAKAAAVPPAPAPPTKTDAEWEKLLGWNRRKKVWDANTQGPPPHSPGCIVPGHLLKPDDGKGWIDFKDYRP